MDGEWWHEIGKKKSLEILDSVTKMVEVIALYNFAWNHNFL